MRKRNVTTEKDIRVVIYVRVSKYRADQTTIITQEKEARKYCADRGWQVVNVQTDEGRSAFKATVKRPGFERAMQMIETHEATVLLVWRFDRFYRSMIEFVKAWERINRVGGELVSVTEANIDTTNPSGRFMLLGMAYFAEMESHARSERAIPFHTHRIENGKTPGGFRPYGYNRSRNELTLDPYESKTLRDAAKLLIEGKTLAHILTTLNPISSRNGKPMTKRGLRAALMNPTTAGLREGYENEFVTGEWTPILDRETWDAVRAILENPERQKAPTNEVRHLLSGILICERCSKGCNRRKYTHNKSGAVTFRYYCPNPNCGTSIDEAAAERIVLERLWEIVTPRTWETWKLQGHGWNPKTLELIALKRRKLDEQLMDAMDEETINRYDENIARLNAQEQSIKDGSPLDLPNVPDIRGAWETLTVIDQRKVIMQAFNSITLTPSDMSKDFDKRLTMEIAA